MKRRQNTIVAATAVLLLSALIAGCGESGKWVEAPQVLYMYQQNAKARAMMESGDWDSSETVCEDHLEEAREDIEESGANNLILQQLVRTCGNAGFQFGEQVRCTSGRLQVKCL